MYIIMTRKGKSTAMNHTSPGNSDWREGKTVVQCNRYMLENELHCDVAFIVGGGEEREIIGAHKYILVARSEVFEAMFTGLLHEQSDKIEIPDVSPAAFRRMLEYMYYDYSKIEENDAYELLYVSRKYLVTGLTHRCLQKLKAKMSVDNVCLILNFAMDETTVDLCLRYIFRYSSEVLKSNGFKELAKEHVLKIISSSRLSAREEDVFESVVSWSQQECQRRDLDVLLENQWEVLGDILKHIRYGRMDRIYVMNVCKKFLPPDMYIEILENLSAEIDLQKNLQTVSISNIPRQNPIQYSTCGMDTIPKTFYQSQAPMEVLDSSSEDSGNTPVASVFSRNTEKFKIYRFEKQDIARGKTYDTQIPDSLSFIMTKNVNLVSILFYGSCHGEGFYHIHLEIFVDLMGHLSLLHSSERDIHTDGSKVQYELQIEPIIQIERERVYTVKALINGPPSFFGTNGKQSVSRNRVTVDFITSDEYDLEGQTTSEGGQFPGLCVQSFV